MLSLPVIKGVAQIVAGLGVSKVVTQVVQNNTTVVTLTDAILIRVGTLVISSMAIDQASSHVGKIIDDVVKNSEERRIDKEKRRIEKQDETTDEKQDVKPDGA
jgi:hypothetical protein